MVKMMVMKVEVVIDDGRNGSNVILKLVSIKVLEMWQMWLVEGMNCFQQTLYLQKNEKEKIGG